MRCPACNARVSADDAKCPACGQELEPTAQRTAQRRTTQSREALNDPEQDLWQGTFSPKGMIGTACSVALLSVLALVGGVLLYNQTDDGLALGLAVLAVLLMWAGFGLTLLYRRMTVRYRLTSQRFFHESGLLRRIINRIDVIDMDDITTEQSLLDRLVGVGTIRIASSDRTHPMIALRGIDHVQEVASKFDAARRRERVRRGMFIEAV